MEHDEWLLEIFTRPATAEDWYFSPDLDPPHDDEAELAAHLGWLLEAPGARLVPFDDLMVAAGIAWLNDSAEPMMLRGLGSQRIGQEARLDLVAGLGRLFAEVFARRCAEALGHLSEDGGPLGSACYMFWDNFHLDAPPDAGERDELRARVVATQGEILSLPHAACQEAALHGLGHWRDADPARAEALIDAYLARGAPARPELVPYARAARSGCVL